MIIMEYEKIIFNFPKEYKRKLEKLVALENIEREKQITLTDLISEILINEFDLDNEKTPL
jgi:patatin-like phospholipase/acyl hydrolase